MEAVMFVAGLAIGLLAASVLLSLKRGSDREALATHAAEKAAWDREREVLESRIDDAQTTDERIRESLQAMTGEAVQKAQKQLLEMTDGQRKADAEAAARELDKRTSAIRETVAPVAKTLKSLEERITTLDRNRAGNQAQIKQLFDSMRLQVDKLGGETSQLVTALRKPQVRGSWGEMQLKTCVEAANMVEHVHFHQQQTLDADDRRLRPDMTISMPGGGSVIVDSKVPLSAYLDAIEMNDGEERLGKLRQHAQQLKTHLSSLSAKSYHSALDQAPEFVICFVPNEAIFAAALNADPTLLEYGAQNRVLLATPATLMALLHAVHYGWNQEKLAEEVRAIEEHARDLHKRTGSFIDHLNKAGASLGTAVGHYNAAIGSFQSRLMPQLRKIEDAGIRKDQEVANLKEIDKTPAAVLEG